jgi:hypothetical protein
VTVAASSWRGGKFAMSLRPMPSVLRVHAL